MTILYHC